MSTLLGGQSMLSTLYPIHISACIGRNLLSPFRGIFMKIQEY